MNGSASPRSTASSCLAAARLEQLREGRLAADHLPVLRAKRQNLVTLLQEQAEDAFPFYRASGVLRVEGSPRHGGRRWHGAAKASAASSAGLTAAGPALTMSIEALTPVSLAVSFAVARVGVGADCPVRSQGIHRADTRPRRALWR